MITGVDIRKAMFLSVALKDGSIEAFDNVNDAVAHATARVKDDETERAIFVAMPRARVRLAVHVEPIDSPQIPSSGSRDVPSDITSKAPQRVPSHYSRDAPADKAAKGPPKVPAPDLGNAPSDEEAPTDPLPLPSTEAGTAPPDSAAWQQSRDLMPRSDGADRDEQSRSCDIYQHHDSDKEPDRKLFDALETDLASLELKLHRARLEYEQARTGGDDERIDRLKLQMAAIEAEQSRLTSSLLKRQTLRPRLRQRAADLDDASCEERSLRR